MKDTYQCGFSTSWRAYQQDRTEGYGPSKFQFSSSQKMQAHQQRCVRVGSSLSHIRLLYEQIQVDESQEGQTAF